MALNPSNSSSFEQLVLKGLKSTFVECKTCPIETNNLHSRLKPNVGGFIIHCGFESAFRILLLHATKPERLWWTACKVQASRAEIYTKSRDRSATGINHSSEPNTEYRYSVWNRYIKCSIILASHLDRARRYGRTWTAKTVRRTWFTVRLIFKTCPT